MIIWKKFLKKIAKMDYFRRFFKKIKNPALNFRALDEKPNCVGYFWKFFQRFLWEKRTKNAIFWSIFKIRSKLCVKFSRVLTKNNWFGNFWETFKNFFENSAKMHYFGLFSKEIQKPALNFRAFRRKTYFFWDFLRKF